MTEKGSFIRMEQQDWKCSKRFFFIPPLTHHLTTKNILSTFLSLCFLSHLSVCLASPLPHCLFLSLVALPLSLPFSQSPFLSCWISLSLSSCAPAKTDESGMFPHCTQRWMTAVLNRIVCLFFPPFSSIWVFSHIFRSFFSNLFPSTCMMHTKPHGLCSVSLPLSVYIIPLFRDFQSSASKLGYSMPLPNCPTAWGSDRSS